MVTPWALALLSRHGWPWSRRISTPIRTWVIWSCRTGDPKKALEMYTKANTEAKIDPDHPFEMAIIGMSGVYMVLGDDDAALKWAIKAAQMFPRSGPIQIWPWRTRSKGKTRRRAKQWRACAASTPRSLSPPITTNPDGGYRCVQGILGEERGSCIAHGRTAGVGADLDRRIARLHRAWRRDKRMRVVPVRNGQHFAADFLSVAKHEGRLTLRWERSRGRA